MPLQSIQACDALLLPRFVPSSPVGSRQSRCRNTNQVNYSAGCLEGRYLPLKEDTADLQRVLGGYSFDERDPVLGMPTDITCLLRS